MDVVRHLADFDRRGKLLTIFGDDPCLGVHLRLAVTDEEEPLPMLQLDDLDSTKVFAMNPTCRAPGTTMTYGKEGFLWSPVTNRSWVVHHVNETVIRCMWEADLAAGYYKDQAKVFGRWNSNHLGAVVWVDHTRPKFDMPDLCGCVPIAPRQEEDAAPDPTIDLPDFLQPNYIQPT